ncbi:hypothetical protein MMC18_004440 [Xylographa bjoerkii]|nr:hypothetical protein [Xylographa bjoerkii]
MDGLKSIQGIKDLSLRLNNSPHPDAISIIKSTTLTLTGRTHIPSEPFRFTELPAEIRHHVLSFTNLVPGYNSRQWYSRGIEIKDGKVSRLLNAAATYVCFSKNRFILSSESSFASHLAFLRGLPDHALDSICRLDIQIANEQARCFASNDLQSATANQFSELLGEISFKFNLSSLHLTLDSGWMNMDYCMRRETDDNLEWLRRAYREIGNIIASKFKGRGLDRFEIFLSEWFEEVDRIETMVLGTGYDALARGKVYWADRQPFDPHTKPDEEDEAAE